MPLKIAICSDHAGFDLKQILIDFLKADNHLISDLGCNSTESVDYPDYGYKIADYVASESADYGIAICGSGIGISIACNRNRKVRAALCTSQEMAKLAREHNNANILVLGARLTDTQSAKKMVKEFLDTDFASNRHSKRVEKLRNVL